MSGSAPKTAGGRRGPDRSISRPGLLDDLSVTIAPVTLGGGKPLLPRAIATPPLELASSEVYDPFVQLRYAVRTRT
jgi:dihydrofolate reductase